MYRRKDTHVLKIWPKTCEIHIASWEKEKNLKLLLYALVWKVFKIFCMFKRNLKKLMLPLVFIVKSFKDENSL